MPQGRGKSYFIFTTRWCRHINDVIFRHSSFHSFFPLFVLSIFLSSYQSLRLLRSYLSFFIFIVSLVIVSLRLCLILSLSLFIGLLFRFLSFSQSDTCSFSLAFPFTFFQWPFPFYFLTASLLLLMAITKFLQRL